MNQVATRGASQGIARDNAVVATGTALSRITGVVRLVALLVAVDTSLQDAWLLANNTPNIIYELILGGVLTATLVPLFTDHLVDGDEDATSVVVSVVTVALFVATALGFVVGPLLILLYSTNPGPEVDVGALRSVGIRLSLFFAPQIFFYGMMAIGKAILEARKRFFAAAWAPVLNNVIVSSMLFSVPFVVPGERDLAQADDGGTLLWLLGLGTTAGIVAMAVSLWPAIRRAGVRLRFRFDVAHPSVRRALRLSGWTIGYVIANQIAIQVVNILAQPGSGGVTQYQVAFMFFQLPHGLLAVSLMTTFLPDLSRHASEGDDPAYHRRLLLGLRLLGLVVVPAAIAYLVLPVVVADTVSASGVDTGNVDVVGIARVLAGFSLGLIGFSAYLFILRAFYARQNTRTPFLINCFENGLNIALALVLVGPFDVVGLSVAYAVAYLVSAVLALGVLLRRVPGFDLRGLVDSYGRLAAAAVGMGLVVWLVAGTVTGDTITSLVIAVIAAGAAGAATYGGVAWGLRVPQTTGVALPARWRRS